MSCKLNLLEILRNVSVTTIFPDVFFSTSYIDTCLWVYTQNLGVCWTFAESTVNLWQKGRRKKTPLYLVSTPGPPRMLARHYQDDRLIYHCYLPLLSFGGGRTQNLYLPLHLYHFHHTSTTPPSNHTGSVTVASYFTPWRPAFRRKNPSANAPEVGRFHWSTMTSVRCRRGRHGARPHATARHGTWESMMMIFLSGLFPVLLRVRYMVVSFFLGGW